MAHAQTPDFVFRLNGRAYLNRRGRQFSRQLVRQLCTSACRVYTARASLCSAVMWRLLATHSILVSPSLLPCVTTCHHISNAVYPPETRWRNGSLRKLVIPATSYHVTPLPFPHIPMYGPQLILITGSTRTVPTTGITTVSYSWRILYCEPSDRSFWPSLYTHINNW
jgi:hypothetical protein